jgi:hypothetical protein
MKVRVLLSKVILGFFLLAVISNCSKKEESPNPINPGIATKPAPPQNNYVPPAITFTSTVMGFVQDENGVPIQDAIVSASGKTFTTDENGAFEITDAAFTGDFCFIKAEKQGYFTASTTIMGNKTDVFTTELVMQPQNNIVSFNTNQEKSITLGGGAAVNFPKNAVEMLDGEPYTGVVKVAVNHLNPTAPNFFDVIPGGDLRAFSAQGEDVQLYSYGMLNVELFDDAGNYLQVAKGKKVELKMPVPDEMKNNAPATIPLWYFDEEEGVWIEEGSAQLINGSYVGKVSHFTSWNCDIPAERADLSGKVADCFGDGVADLKLRVGQRKLKLDGGGNWRCFVPSGIDIDISAIKDGNNSEIVLNKTVEALRGGENFNVGVIKVNKCKAKITAKVYNCNNESFNGYSILKIKNRQIKKYIRNGDYSMGFFEDYDEEAQLFFYQPASGQLQKINIIIPKEGKLHNLGDIKTCKSKQETYFVYKENFTNKTIDVDKINDAGAVYYSDKDVLVIQVISDNKTINQLVINKPKKGINTAYSATDSIGILREPLDRTTLFSNDYTASLRINKLTVDITDLEATGGRVAGAFYGEAYPLDKYRHIINQKTEITKGQFSVLRLPDK